MILFFRVVTVGHKVFLLATELAEKHCTVFLSSEQANTVTGTSTEW